MNEWQAWARVPHDELMKLLEKLAELGFAWMELADDRGGNGGWIVTVKVGKHGTPIDKLPKSQQWTRF